MYNKNNFKFGHLTTKQNSQTNITLLLNKNTKELEYLFKNTDNEIKRLNVVEAERQIALNQLREMTTLLQTRRLRNKAKSSNKYFTL